MSEAGRIFGEDDSQENMLATRPLHAKKGSLYVYLRIAWINAKFILIYSGRAPESDQLSKTTRTRRNIET